MFEAIQQAERCTIAALVFMPGKVYDFLEKADNAGYFTTQLHADIYHAVCKLSNQRTTISSITVASELNTGLAVIENFLKYLPASDSNVFDYIELLRDNYLRAQVRKACAEIMAACDNAAPAEEIIEMLEDAHYQIHQQNHKTEAVHVSEYTPTVLESIEDARHNQGLIGLDTGHVWFNTVYQGWQNKFYVIGARPSMGKTSFILSVFRELGLRNMPVLFFSIEMTTKSVVNRLVMMNSTIDTALIRSGQITDKDMDDLRRAAMEVDSMPFYIDSNAGITAHQIRSRIRTAILKYGIQAVAIDYLEKITPSKRQFQREQEVAEMSRILSGVPNEFNIPLFLLAQLNRDVEKRGGDKRPQPSDLRYSGAIEQDADSILFIHRPEVYGLLETEEGESTQNLAEIIVAKHRDGEIGTYKMHFDKKRTLFLNEATQIPF